MLSSALEPGALPCKGVNFFAHAWLASKREDDHGYVFGSMLPDFCTMASARMDPAHTPPRSIARGVDFHHHCDEVFHGSPIFVEEMGRGREELEAEGLELGPAMAVGHVGVELVLDGWLWELSEGSVPFDGAIERGANAQLRFRDSDQGLRFSNLMQRLSGSSLPSRYRGAPFITEILQRILSARPRLALQDKDLPIVERWVRAQQQSSELWAPDLMREVEVRLDASSTSETSPGEI